MEFRILGPLEISDEGRRVELPRAKQRALLAALLLRRGEVVSVDRLIEDLWGERPPRAAVGSLHNLVSALRKTLGVQTLRRQPPGYVLEIDPAQLDLHRFTRLVGEARETNDARTRAALLRDALSLWRGPPLADVAFEPFAAVETAHLEELRLAAREDLAETELALGRDASVVEELEALIGEQPYRERPRALLMLALYRCGRQADALETFAAARRVLRDELGLEPSPELKKLQQAILRQDSSLDRSAALAITANDPAPAPSTSPRDRRGHSNLPTQPTRFLGRERELAEVISLLGDEDVRLLTLTGAGGSGKTRLALEAAGTLTAAYPDGVWWVPLAAIADPRLVLAQIARTVAAEQELRDHLAEAQTLLLLDNFEHLLPAGPELAELLAACPNLKLLVTSREPLHLAAEREYLLPRLGDEDAVELFRHRAHSAEPEATVLAICRRLDCLPLAIELAAARTKLLPPTTLLARLEQRLPLLTGGPRDAPERHRTLEATIAWSHALLTKREQRTFAQLAVFAGGCTLEAAEQICEADLDTLQALVDKHLLRRENDRYQMLETIHEYAAKQLAEDHARVTGDRAANLVEAGPAHEARSRHATYYGAKAAQLEQRSHASRDQQEELRRWAEVEQDNARAALAFLRETGDADAEAALLVTMHEFWKVRGGFDENSGAFEQLLSRPLSDTNRANVLSKLARIVATRGDTTSAVALAREAVAIARSLSDPIALANALVALGCALDLAEDFTAADRCFAELEALSRQPEIAGWRGTVLNNLASGAIRRGEYALAIPMLEESAALLEMSAIPLNNLGLTALLQDRHEEAVAHFAQGLESARAVGWSEAMVESLEGIAAATASSDPRTAARLFEAAAVERARIGFVQPAFEAEVLRRAQRGLEATLGSAEMSAAAATAATMPFDDTVELALATVRGRNGDELAVRRSAKTSDRSRARSHS